MTVAGFDPSAYRSRDEAVAAIESRFSCACDRLTMTRRAIRGGAVQIVMQCQHCGRAATSPVSKAAVPKWAALPAFDEERNGEWRRGRDLAYQAAYTHFRGRWHDAYDDYLQSPAWQRRRGLVLRRANGICEGCGEAKATQVHHRTYDHVGDELLFELVAVCDVCHAKAHDDREEPHRELGED